jgi:hypothetical protein
MRSFLRRLFRGKKRRVIVLDLDELQNDPELRELWLSNIAMTMYDRWFASGGMHIKMTQSRALSMFNAGANDFLNLLCADTTLLTDDKL